MKIKVLIVDDEAPFADALTERLTLRSFSVQTAGSGRQCLEILEAQPQETDVVVLDLQMPGLSGLDTLKILKEKSPLIQVILLSGHATVDAAIQGMKQGAFDFLLKPTETEALAAKIEAAFAIKAAHEERIRNAELNTLLTEKGW